MNSANRHPRVRRWDVGRLLMFLGVTVTAGIFLAAATVRPGAGQTTARPAPRRTAAGAVRRVREPLSAAEIRRINARLPKFWKTAPADIAREVKAVRKGKATVIARSPGGREVHAIAYGPRGDSRSLANYNSASGARRPGWYAHKPAGTRPTVMFLGPVHGQEVEGIAGLINLIHLAETGRDHSGKARPKLLEYFRKCRVLIVPLANPDGRARCPLNGFHKVPIRIMNFYGMGTRADGTLYSWPRVKGRQPMVGDVGYLGAYHNDAGVNLMQDDFFGGASPETAAVLDLAKREAPDYIPVLHSHGQRDQILMPTYVPHFIKRKVKRIADRIAERFKEAKLEFRAPRMPKGDVQKAPAKTFNLTNALHHVSGGTAFTWECSHGVLEKSYNQITPAQTLEAQMILYEEVLKFAVQNPVRWDRTGRP